MEFYSLAKTSGKGLRNGEEGRGGEKAWENKLPPSVHTCYPIYHCQSLVCHLSVRFYPPDSGFSLAVWNCVVCFFSKFYI